MTFTMNDHGPVAMMFESIDPMFIEQTVINMVLHKLAGQK
jgi:hypothetical protein